MFRPLVGHLQALWRTDPRTIYISMHRGIQNAYMLCYRNVIYGVAYIRYITTSDIFNPFSAKNVT